MYIRTRPERTDLMIAIYHIMQAQGLDYVEISQDTLKRIKRENDGRFYCYFDKTTKALVLAIKEPKK